MKNLTLPKFRREVLLPFSGNLDGERRFLRNVGTTGSHIQLIYGPSSSSPPPSSSSSSSSSSALQIRYSLGFLNNILPFKAILDLFYPFYKFRLSQIVPDVVFKKDYF